MVYFFGGDEDNQKLFHEEIDLTGEIDNTEVFANKSTSSKLKRHDEIQTTTLHNGTTISATKSKDKSSQSVSIKFSDSSNLSLE